MQTVNRAMEKQKTVKATLSLRKPSTAVIKQIKSKYEPSTVVTREVDYSNLFGLLDYAYVNDVLGFVKPHPDGNWGYRAVSLTVLDHEIA
ncbi:hypothetical protein INT47_001030 [Mucor saturninus]|uniref:Uncharacterized protein n=1 Tax=Mucor saturninus TaxID=64648 RepID=A0A8H7UVA8_9FUNG|nr:hypothetical protein INT47_001030 [Mucor saturninus]